LRGKLIGRDLGSQVVLVVLGAQRGVLGRLGHPTDLDLALGGSGPPANRTRAPILKQGAEHLGVRKAALTRRVDHLEQAVCATRLETMPEPGGIILTRPARNSHKKYHQSWPCSTERATTPQAQKRET